MSEVSWTLRKTLADLRATLYERRGEHLLCHGCALQLVCFMKRVPTHRERPWCDTCAGVVYEEEKLIVRCRIFFPSTLTKRHLVRCPNCYKASSDFKTYRIVQNNFHKLDHTVG
jgi:hypothetical protein